MRQILAFIDPDTFSGLLADKSIQIGFKTRLDGITSVLAGGQHIFCVNKNGTSRSSVFDSELVKQASYVLVPDDLRSFDDYEPQGEFAVLYHNGTRRRLQLNHFPEMKGFRGMMHSNEMGHTIYGRLAQQIGRKKEFDFEAIWEEIYRPFVRGQISQVLSEISSGKKLNEIEIPEVLWCAISGFQNLKTRLGGVFNKDIPSNMTAYREFEQILRSEFGT